MALAILISVFSGCREEAPEPLNILGSIPEYRLAFSDLPDNCAITDRLAEQLTMPISSDKFTITYLHPYQAYTEGALNGYDDSEQVANYSRAANVEVKWGQPGSEQP